METDYAQVPYTDWTIEHVAQWLESTVWLPQYKEKFAELAIDGGLLQFIEDQDLINDAGINIWLHRVKILESIKKLSIQFSASAIELA